MMTSFGENTAWKSGDMTESSKAALASHCCQKKLSWGRAYKIEHVGTCRSACESDDE